MSTNSYSGALVVEFFFQTWYSGGGPEVGHRGRKVARN
jgi:hypothetical protein